MPDNEDANYPQDNKDVLPRPDWFKWRGKDWITATLHWAADQKGWYHDLLMWAAVQGDPPGYLPSDESKLKRIAGYEDPTKSTYGLILINSSNDAGLEIFIKEQESKWAEVMRKFQTSRDYEGLVYNRNMLNTIEDAMQYHLQRSRGGQKAAALMHSKPANKTSQTLGTSSDVSSASRDLVAGKEHKKESPETVQTSRESSSANSQLSLVSSSATTRASSSLSSSFFKDKPSLLTKKLPNKPTLFDESKFQVTNEMRDTIRKRHPELSEEDYQEIRETFCHNRYGQSQLSWKRQFYTYVHNQITKYDYVPISQRPLSISAILQNGVNKNGTRYESAAEKNARLEADNDEYLERLRTPSSGDNPEDQKSLRLTPDDVNRTR